MLHLCLRQNDDKLPPCMFHLFVKNSIKMKNFLIGEPVQLEKINTDWSVLINSEPDHSKDREINDDGQI